LHYSTVWGLVKYHKSYTWVIFSDQFLVFSWILIRRACVYSDFSGALYEDYIFRSKSLLTSGYYHFQLNSDELTLYQYCAERMQYRESSNSNLFVENRTRQIYFTEENDEKEELTKE